MICHEPFNVVIYNEATLKKYHKKPGKLHVDATGSAVRKVSKKTVYCNAVIAEDEQSGRTYPVCVALCNSHTSEDITTLLVNVRRGFRLVTGNKNGAAS